MMPFIAFSHCAFTTLSPFAPPLPLSLSLPALLAQLGVAAAVCVRHRHSMGAGFVCPAKYQNDNLRTFANIYFMR